MKILSWLVSWSASFYHHRFGQLLIKLLSLTVNVQVKNLTEVDSLKKIQEIPPLGSGIYLIEHSPNFRLTIKAYLAPVPPISLMSPRSSRVVYYKQGVHCPMQRFHNLYNKITGSGFPKGHQGNISPTSCSQH